MGTRKKVLAWRLILTLVLTCLPLAELSAKDDVWTPSEFVVASGFDKVLGAISMRVRDAVNSPELSQASKVEKLKEVWKEAVASTVSQKLLQDHFVRELKGAKVAESTGPDRARLIKELIERAGGVETGWSVTVNASFAMLKGMQAAGTIPLQMPDKKLWELLQQNEASLRKQMGAQLALSTAYTYRELSNKELEACISF